MDRQAVVIGAGIVGLATARALRRAQPSLPVVVLDKEDGIARHQSGRNSGVIHAGVYYKPGSEKARLCAAGRVSMVEYCRERGIPHEVCGKLVVAVTPDEIGRMEDLYRRCPSSAWARPACATSSRTWAASPRSTSPSPASSTTAR